MTELTERIDQSIKAIHNREGKYLTFSLADEEYGIGILKIREIIGMMPITSVPQTPGFVKGVINLRGKVIPISRYVYPKPEFPERILFTEHDHWTADEVAKLFPNTMGRGLINPSPKKVNK